MRWTIARAALPIVLVACGTDVPERSAEIEQVFGAVREDGADRFALIGGLATDADGRVWVADELGSEIMVFAPDGPLAFRVGSPGTEPGEFASTCCLTFDGQGRLWTYDLGNRRYQVFQPTESGADLLFEVPAAHGAEILGLSITFDAAGRVNDVREDEESYDGGAVRYLLDSLGTVSDSIRFASMPIDSLELYPVRTLGGEGLVSPPFGPRDVLAFGPGGDHARANTRRLRVNWYGPDGLVVASIVDEAATGPVLTTEQRAEGEEILGEDAKRLGISVMELGPLLPFRNQVLAGLFFDRTGRLWLERSMKPDDERMAEVYNRDGSLAFTARWPADVELSELSWVDDDIAIGIRKGSAPGGEQVVRLRWR